MSNNPKVRASLASYCVGRVSTPFDTNKHNSARTAIVWAEAHNIAAQASYIIPVSIMNCRDSPTRNKSNAFGM